ncbi:uncharacterized protein PHACADRAFT_265827, partial [Phanerochaete carnosa HHB-10118-sp]
MPVDRTKSVVTIHTDSSPDSSLQASHVFSGKPKLRRRSSHDTQRMRSFFQAGGALDSQTTDSQYINGFFEGPGPNGFMSAGPLDEGVGLRERGKDTEQQTSSGSDDRAINKHSPTPSHSPLETTLEPNSDQTALAKHELRSFAKLSAPSTPSPTFLANVSSSGTQALEGSQQLDSPPFRINRPLVLHVHPSKMYPGTRQVYRKLDPALEPIGKTEYEIQEAARVEYLRRVGLRLLPMPSENVLRIALVPI